MVKIILIWIIKRRIKKRMLKKLFSKDNLKDGAIGALIIGGIASVLGIDIAPTEVDALVTGLATLLALGIRIKDRFQAK